MKSCIYKIEHVVKGKVYIGSATNLIKRFSAHRVALRSSKHPNEKLQRAWDKYGEHSFTFSVIEFVEKNDLIHREQFWIDSLRSVDFGYNISPIAGSSLGRKTSKETKEKLSKIFTGRTPHPNCIAALTGRFYSQETRAKLSAGRRGKTGYRHTSAWKAAKAAMQTGRKHSEESRQKMAVAQRGRVISEEHRKKISLALTGKKAKAESRTKQSAAMRGRKVSAETRAKISDALTGKKRSHLSDECRAKLSMSMKGRVWSPQEISKRVATRTHNAAMGRDLSAASNALSMKTKPSGFKPPTEPAGRAPAGQSFQR